MMNRVERWDEAKMIRPRESTAIPAGFSKYSTRLGSGLPTILSTHDFFFLGSTSRLLLNSSRNLTRGLSGGSGQISCAELFAFAFCLSAAAALLGSRSAATAPDSRTQMAYFVRFFICSLLAISSLPVLALFLAWQRAAWHGLSLPSRVALAAHRCASALPPFARRRSLNGKHHMRRFSFPSIPPCAPGFLARPHDFHGSSGTRSFCPDVEDRPRL